MFDFYHRILGCTIDEPIDEHVNRFGGSLTHLRAGSCYIDLLAYDTNHVTKEGQDALARMHAGGAGLDDSKSIDDFNISSDASTLDHLCLRIDPFDKQKLLTYLKEENVDIVTVGDTRLGADGVNQMIYYIFLGALLKPFSIFQLSSTADKTNQMRGMTMQRDPISSTSVLHSK